MEDFNRIIKTVCPIIIIEFDLSINRIIDPFFRLGTKRVTLTIRYTGGHEGFY